MLRIGVTGTDTGVGKTVITCGLIDALHARGMRVSGMKPIETGGNEDAQRIRTASRSSLPLECIGPLVLPEPLAPLLAARRSRTNIDIAQIDAAFRRLEAENDAIVVEGAGGILVPFTEREDFASLCKRWSLDLVVVAANRLGVINHTLLTLEAAAERGLRVRAVVLNAVGDAAAATVAEQTNLALLQELCGDFPVLEVPHSQAGGGGPGLALAMETLLGVLDVRRPDPSQPKTAFSPTTSS